MCSIFGRCRLYRDDPGAAVEVPFQQVDGFEQDTLVGGELLQVARLPLALHELAQGVPRAHQVAEVERQIVHYQRDRRRVCPRPW